MRESLRQPPLTRSLGTRLQEQFAPAYLTLTSIIQGVALSARVGRVEATSAHFDAADWVVAAATLVAFLAVWHEYLMQALAYVWLPTLLDSVVPFAFLVAELFMAHFVYGNQRAWLLAASLCLAVGVVAAGTSQVKARAQSHENVGVLRAVARVSALRLALTVVPAAAFLGACAGYDALGLDRSRLPVALGALLIVIVVVAGTIPYWNRILRYARNESTLA